MTRKGGNRYKVSLCDSENKDSFTHSYVTPFEIDENDLKDMYLMLTDCRVNEILQAKLGYNYEPVNLNLCTVSLKVSYEFGGIPYTSEKLYFKYVRSGMAKEEIFLSELKKIFGVTAEIFGFRVSYK